jgi:uncharacterized protein YqeY
MPTLKDQLQSDMKDAMRAKETVRLGTIRMLMAAYKKHEIDSKATLDDTGILKIIQKQIKQRRDSITQFEAAGRTELAEKEQQELQILETYLPEQLDEATIKTIVGKAITDTGAESMKDMGKLMGVLKPQLDGKADMGLVSKMIKESLNS